MCQEQEAIFLSGKGKNSAGKQERREKPSWQRENPQHVEEGPPFPWGCPMGQLQQWLLSAKSSTEGNSPGNWID